MVSLLFFPKLVILKEYLIKNFDLSKLFTLLCEKFGK